MIYRPACAFCRAVRPWGRAGDPAAGAGMRSRIHRRGNHLPRTLCPAFTTEAAWCEWGPLRGDCRLACVSDAEDSLLDANGEKESEGAFSRGGVVGFFCPVGAGGHTDGTEPRAHALGYRRSPRWGWGRRSDEDGARVDVRGCCTGRQTTKSRRTGHRGNDGNTREGIPAGMGARQDSRTRAGASPFLFEPRARAVGLARGERPFARARGYGQAPRWGWGTCGWHWTQGSRPGLQTGAPLGLGVCGGGRRPRARVCGYGQARRRGWSESGQSQLPDGPPNDEVSGDGPTRRERAAQTRRGSSGRQLETVECRGGASARGPYEVDGNRSLTVAALFGTHMVFPSATLDIASRRKGQAGGDAAGNRETLYSPGVQRGSRRRPKSVIL